MADATLETFQHDTPILDEAGDAPTNTGLPIFGVRAMSEAGDLCITCDTAFDWLTRPKVPVEYQDFSKQYGPHLGWVDRLMATKECVLCQFVARIFLQNPVGLSSADITHQRRFICQIANSGPVSKANGLRLDWDIRVNFLEGSDSDFNEGDVQQWDTRWSPRFRLLAKTIESLIDERSGYHESDKVSNLAIPVTEQCSRQFIERFYRLCAREHGDSCDVLKTVLYDTRQCMVTNDNPNEQHFPTYLVDVFSRKIVLAPRDSRYVALTYCWPDKTQGSYLVLLRSNEHLLKQNNNIDPGLLAPVVADAMEVVITMGEQYLWVDSLCIIQDDQERKMPEIMAMGRIYQRAALTIVAAAPADAGLPGIRDNTRSIYQDVAEIRRLKLVSGLPHVQDVLRFSRWNTRAWTYQEHLLSKRELIFTPYQLHYVCATDCFAEGHLNHKCIQDAQSAGSDKCCSYKAPDAFDERMIHSRVGEIRYDDIVSDITTRNLTFESDALNAIAGMLNMVTEALGVSFVCGLPIPYLFDQFLFWLPVRTLRRRGPSSRGLPFPSWAWVGWVGQATLLSGPEHLIWGTYTSAPNGEGFPPCQMLLPTASGQPDLSLSGIGYKVVSPYHPSLGQHESVLLQFTSSSAMAPISLFAWGSHAYDHGSVDSMCHAVCVSGSCAGLVLYNSNNQLSRDMDLYGHSQEEAWSKSVNCTQAQELVCLSETNTPWNWALKFSSPAGNDDETRYRQRKYWDSHKQDLFLEGWYDGKEEDALAEGLDLPNDAPYDVNKWEKGRKLVNVMVIEWQNDVAFRLGVGQIHVDAWQSLTLERKSIILG